MVMMIKKKTGHVMYSVLLIKNSRQIKKSNTLYMNLHSHMNTKLKILISVPWTKIFVPSIIRYSNQFFLDVNPNDERP